MESDLTGAVFLEFYGLPGSGKSTVSHLVAEKLRSEGKTVLEPTYNVDHKYLGIIRKVIKLLNMVRYSLVHPKKYKDIVRLVKSNGYGGTRSVLFQVANVTLKLWVYDRGVAEYVIFDEGLTQSAIALAQKGKLSSIENEKQLYSLCKKRSVEKIYIVVADRESINRLSERDNHDSRIEKIQSIGEREKALRFFKEQCELISGNRVDGSQSQHRVMGFVITLLR